MIAIRSYFGDVIFITDFDEKYNLVNRFKSTDLLKSHYNRPVDFVSTGLIRKSEIDPWLPDVVLSITTDEATPVEVCGEYIGGNHGDPCLLKMRVSNHTKTVADIGSVWTDGEGINFTLLRVEENYLYFVSDNLTGDKLKYCFKRSLSGSLIHKAGAINVEEVVTESVECVYLSSSLRHIDRRIVCHRDGLTFELSRSAECDSAEIIDEYVIINPATVAEDVVRRRPANGYCDNPFLSEYGEGMIRYKAVYRIDETGAVLTDFEQEKLFDVSWERTMGHMSQKRRDAFGGGIYRYIPDSIAFSATNGEFDYSSPVSIEEGEYPETAYLGREAFLDKDYPLDRIVDIFKDRDGNACLGYATGYLPIYDGTPEIRKERITNAVFLYRSKKYYPTFANKNFNSAKGVGYKKYFKCCGDTSYHYSVDYEGKRYHYLDFFGNDKLVLDIAADSHIHHVSGDAEVLIEGDHLFACGSHGSVVVIENIAKAK